MNKFPNCLLNATPEQRNNYELSGGGTGIHWEEIDEDISVPVYYWETKIWRKRRRFNPPYPTPLARIKTPILTC